MSDKILVEDVRPGKNVITALAGPGMDLFQIFADGDAVAYYVNHTRVTREVYYDALETVKQDRYDPEILEEDMDEVIAS